MSDDKEFWNELLGSTDAEADLEQQADRLMQSGDDFADSFFDEPIPELTEEEEAVFAQPEELFAQPVPEEEEEEDLSAKTEVVRDISAVSATVPQRIREAEREEPASPVSEDSFRVDFDFQKEYKVSRRKRAIRRSGVKRTGISGGIAYFLFIVAVSALIAATGWLAATDVLGFKGVSEEVTVTVEKDTDLDDVTDMLYNNGLIKYKKLFQFYAGFSHAMDKISYGTYVLNKDYDYRALVNGMTSAGGTRVVVQVTIPEGYSLRKTIEVLAENNVCDAEDLWKEAASFAFEYDFLERAIGDDHRLEGFLFPDTYDFYLNDKPSRVLNKMLANFDDRWLPEYDEVLFGSEPEPTEEGEEPEEPTVGNGYTVEQIVTVASIIEREAGNDSERADIASVIFNRLDAGMPLQMDSTIHYICNETGISFSTGIPSPYNTYMHGGLPEGPICNPGMASIKAALYPSETDYYYFGVDTDGNTRFFTNLDSFNAFTNSEEYGG